VTFLPSANLGNILVIEEEGSNEPSPKLGLIDYGQCKRLTSKEQVRIAQLILSVANNECDENVANAFRNLGITTKNDSTEFLSSMARLMFGPLLPQHMNPKFHRSLHESDKIIYFPKELSMVYRTALLLRGLAISLQLNYSVGAQWKHHAQEAVERHPEWVMDTKTRRPVSAGVSDSTQPLLSPPVQLHVSGNC
jgi:aarF domain-containing kinase